MADGKLCYNPDIFRVRNLDEARRIILTNEGPADTGECRRKERPTLAAGLCRELNLRKNQLLLDYGCGVGRLARELCALGCSVIGVDISPEMRTMARDDVDIRELTAQFFSLSSTRQFPAGAGIAPHLALCRTYLKTRDHL